MRFDNQIFMSENNVLGYRQMPWVSLIISRAYVRKKIVNLKTLIHAKANIGYRCKKMHKKHEQ